MLGKQNPLYTCTHSINQSKLPPMWSAHESWTLNLRDRLKGKRTEASILTLQSEAHRQQNWHQVHWPWNPEAVSCHHCSALESLCQVNLLSSLSNTLANVINFALQTKCSSCSVLDCQSGVTWCTSALRFVCQTLTCGAELVLGV